MIIKLIGFMIFFTVQLSGMSFANNPASIEYVNKKIAEVISVLDGISMWPQGPQGTQGPQGPQGQSAATYTLGQQVYGGYVFWLDTSNPDSANQHGLIFSIQDVAASVPWSNVTTTTFADNEWVGGGQFNTAVAMSKLTSDAAISAINACSTYKVLGNGAVGPCNNMSGFANYYCYSSWYLPSINELLLLSDFAQIYPNLFSSIGVSYWSSTENASTPDEALLVSNFGTFNNLQLSDNKTGSSHNVLCIRSF